MEAIRQSAIVALLVALGPSLLAAPGPEGLPSPDPVKLFAEAAARPADAASLPALVVVVDSARGGCDLARQAAELIVQHHPKSAELARVCVILESHDPAMAVPLLRKILAAGGIRDTQGLARFALARHLLDQASALAGAEAAGLEAEAVKLLKEIAAGYSDVSREEAPLGKVAERTLFEALNLVAGKPAPEIEGTDLNGKPLKLSEFKGKVTVLKFWGHW